MLFPYAAYMKKLVTHNAMGTFIETALAPSALLLTLIAQSATASEQQSTTAVASPPAEKLDGLKQARAIVADIQKIVTPNGIDETLILTLGGARQVVNIRGADRDNPILLYVHGGPGSVEMPMA